MKIVVPSYYKYFKCIAGDCTDTCCAGWDVDVDKDSYAYYKKVKGSFGKRLKSVMVPALDGGCTFMLNHGRCPFLNGDNLCDLITELGEEKLCDTCAEFPRFINEYGGVREIGIAPSCITAGEIILGYRGAPVFAVEETDEMPSSYNDITPLTYIQLEKARKTAYHLVGDAQFSISKRCCLLLLFCRDIQKLLDKESDELIENVTRKYCDRQFLERRLSSLEREYGGKEKVLQNLCAFFERFRGMEVINDDWLVCCRQSHDFLSECKTDERLAEFSKEFDTYYKNAVFEYQQILVYYVFRYFLDAVYDYNILLKAKNAVVGYLVLRVMDLAEWHAHGRQFDFERQVYLAHLYSRQFEHSYSNFEWYTKSFQVKRRYALCNLFAILLTI